MLALLVAAFDFLTFASAGRHHELLRRCFVARAAMRQGLLARMSLTSHKPTRTTRTTHRRRHCHREHEEGATEGWV